MSNNSKRFEELIGESVNPEKKPLYSEDYITDKDVLKTINENKAKASEGTQVISEQKENAASEVDKFLAENKKRESGKILSESTKKSSGNDEVLVINL